MKKLLLILWLKPFLSFTAAFTVENEVALIDHLTHLHLDIDRILEEIDNHRREQIEKKSSSQNSNQSEKGTYQPDNQPSTGTYDPGNGKD